MTKLKFPHRLWLMTLFPFILFSCTSELLQTGQEYDRGTNQNLVRQLRYSEFKNEAPNLFEKLKLKQQTEQAKNFVINDFSVDAEYVYVSEHEDGKKTYTFTLEQNEKSWYLENYVLNEQDKGVFDAYIIRYDSIIVNHQNKIGNEEVPKHMQLEYMGQIPDNPSVQKALYCPQVPFQEYIWVPGVCSSSQQHETGDPACLCGTPGHMDCTPADEGFYIIQYTLLPTDCGGGGASPGNSPGTSPITTGPYSPHGSGGINDDDLLLDPCQKAKKTFTKNNGIKSSSVNLAAQTSDTVEHGFSVMNNVNSTSPNPVQNLSIGSYGAIYIPLLPTNPYIIIAHTHNSPATATYSVPSWEDMDGISDAIHQNANFADVNNFMYVTITADGTQYAFMIDDITAFTNYFYFPGTDPNDYQPTLFNEKDDNRAIYYYGKKINGKYTDPLIKENSTNKEEDLKYFMEIANNAGLNVFEIDANFNTFTQITMVDNQITRTQCK